MLKSEKNQRQVAKDLRISRCAVQNIQKKYVESGTIDDLPKCGRPPKNSQRSERQLKTNPKLTAGELQNEWNGYEPVSIWTVRGILRKYGLFGRIADVVHISARSKLKIDYNGVDNTNVWIFPFGRV